MLSTTTTLLLQHDVNVLACPVTNHQHHSHYFLHFHHNHHDHLIIQHSRFLFQNSSNPFSVQESLTMKQFRRSLREIMEINELVFNLSHDSFLPHLIKLIIQNHSTSLLQSTSTRLYTSLITWKVKSLLQSGNKSQSFIWWNILILAKIARRFIENSQSPIHSIPWPWPEIIISISEIKISCFIVSSRERVLAVLLIRYEVSDF